MENRGKNRILGKKWKEMEKREKSEIFLRSYFPPEKNVTIGRVWNYKYSKSKNQLQNTPITFITYAHTFNRTQSNIQLFIWPHACIYPQCCKNVHNFFPFLNATSINYLLFLLYESWSSVIAFLCVLSCHPINLSLNKCANDDGFLSCIIDFNAAARVYVTLNVQLIMRNSSTNE